MLNGADVAGGLVFTSNEEPPRFQERSLVQATDEAIAARIITLRNSSGSWWDTGAKVRFSLAGNQPKFTLRGEDGLWFWSDAGHPSTHILKPGNDRNPDVETVEVASMHLSALCGVPTPKCGLLSFEGQKVYAVERFDRVRAAGGHVIRVHTEDMMQSLGDASGRKILHQSEADSQAAS